MIDISNNEDYGALVYQIALAGIPVVGSVISEIIGYFNEKEIIKRIETLDSKFNQMDASVENIKDIISNFSEHDYYTLRRNLKHLIIDAQPEVVESFNNSIVDFILYDKNRTMAEEASEILRDLNSNDIELLELIKYFMSLNLLQKKKNETLEKINNPDKEKGRWRDRQIIFDERTIFWEDFISFLDIRNVKSKISLDIILNSTFNSSRGDIVYDFAFMGKSFIKLQRLGVLSMDFVTTYGTSSQNNVNRFHLSLFGEKLLTYIDISAKIEKNTL